MERQSLRERYLREEWPRQLGNLASTLARLSSWATDPRHDSITAALLREGALFIEWSAPHVPAHLVPELATAQRELMLWHRAWPVEAARPMLAFRARTLSDRMLELAGLLPKPGHAIAHPPRIVSPQLADPTPLADLELEVPET